MLLDEGLLDRMEVAVRRQALDGRELAPSACTASIRHERTAPAVHQHRAGAADAVLAADVGAGERQLAAQEVDERRARLDLGFVRGAVHRHTDPVSRRHRLALLARRRPRP